MAPANPFLPQSMEQAIRLAEMMARGKMMPAHLQNSPGDCLMVVEQAMRWRMSPFAVAQCTSSIKCKLMFEGKLIAAAIEESGAIEGLLDYTFSGTGADRKITVSATRKGEREPRIVEVVLKDAATDNPLWRRQPDQQLVYHGARVWGRRWTPGVILGVYSREEMGPQGEPFDGVTIEAEAETPDPTHAPPKPETDLASEYAAELVQRINANPATIQAIVADPDTIKRRARLQEKRPELAARVQAAVDAALALLPAGPNEVEEMMT